MKGLRLTDQLPRTAKNCIWFEPPEEADSDSARFAAHALTYGDVEDVAALREQLSDDDLREALDNAPPGIPRSWACWNLMLGRDETPPMPMRRFE
jgi:hypothetical protein